jgi:hypothetical protein
VNFFELQSRSLFLSSGLIFNNEENLYDEFDFLSNYRNISWSDFLSMPVKTRRYLIGKIYKEYEEKEKPQ